jgi:hypothetical protein
VYSSRSITISQGTKKSRSRANPILQRLSSFFQRISTIQKVLPFFCSDHSPELVLTHPLQKLIHTIETLQLNLTLPADCQFLGRKRADRLSLA